MNANELMLNDWVHHINEKEDGQVYEIREDFIEIGVHLPKESQACWINGDPEDFAGIPLTKDILNLNGFRYIYNHSLKYDKPQYFYNEDLDLEINVSTFSMQYVHEFQNLLRLYRFNEQADNFKIK